MTTAASLHERMLAAERARVDASIREQELARAVIQAAKAWRYEGGAVADRRLRDAVERLAVAEVNHEAAIREADAATEAANLGPKAVTP
jgi:hypothetical protein